MADMSLKYEVLATQRSFEKLLPKGRRNKHQVMSTIEVSLNDDFTQNSHMSPRHSRTRRILVISVVEDTEGKKRDPRWSLVTNAKESNPKVVEKRHIKDLERIELTETKESIRVVFLFSPHKPQTVYCQRSQRAQMLDLLWWAVQTSRYYFRNVVASNLNPREVENLTMEWTSVLQSQDWDDPEVRNVVALLSSTQNQILEMLSTDSKEQESKEKEHSSANYQVEVNITSDEAKVIESLLKESGLAVEDIHLLENHLKSELAEMENKNIQALFSHENRVTTGLIVQNMFEIEKMVKEMSTWMKEYDSSLDEMRKGVSTIEARNKKLKIQEHNHQKLHTRLADLLNKLRINTKTQRDLQRPNFRNGLKQMLQAASALNQTMEVRLSADMEKMKAVKQIRSQQKTLAKSFTAEAAKFLSDYFHQMAQKRTAEIKSSGVRSAGTPINRSMRTPGTPSPASTTRGHRQTPSSLSITHSTTTTPDKRMGSLTSKRGGSILAPQTEMAETKAHDNIIKYVDLVSLLAKMETNRFESLLQTYTTEFRKVYEVKIKNFMQMVRKTVPPPPQRDTRMCALRDHSLDPDVAQVTRRDKRLFSRFSDAASSPPRSRNESRLSSNHHSDNDSEMAGRFASSFQAGGYDGRETNSPMASRSPKKRQVDRSSGFSMALDALTPMCRQEQGFIYRFFFKGDGDSKDAKHMDTPQKPALLSKASLSPTIYGESLESIDTKVRSADPQTANVSSPRSAIMLKVDQRVRTMMTDMFKQVVPALEGLAKQETRHDNFQTLRMLLAARAHKDENTDVTFLMQGLTRLQATLHLSFSTFINNEIRWINSQKSNTKRGGILVPLLKFPTFVNKMEGVLDDSQDMQVKITYTKMAKSLFKLITDTADTNQKLGRKMLVLLENFHYFWRVFDTRIPRIRCLDAKVDEAYKLYLTNLREYVKWHVTYELEKLSKFWDDLDDKLSNNQTEELQFLIPKQQVVSMVRKTLPYLERNVQNMMKRVEKHLPTNMALRTEVWRALQEFFLKRFKNFESQVSRCYQNAKLPQTSSDVKKIFAQVLVERKK